MTPGRREQQNQLVARAFDGSTVGASQTVPTSESLADIRGAFMVDGTLYTMVDEPPAAPPAVCAAADTEWVADYFNNRDLVAPSTGSGTVADEQFDINWGSGGPGFGVGTDNFSIRFTRTINLPAPGNYSFDVGSDDGHRLFVTHDGTTTSFERWRDQGYTVSSYDVAIADPCGVELVMEYYENGGGARASIGWNDEPARTRSLRKQTFDGTTFGAPETIDLRLLDGDNPSGNVRGPNVDTPPGTDSSNQVNAITPPNLPNFGNFDIPNSNGMFFDPVTGRMYFTSPQYTWQSGGTRTSPASLAYRTFSTQSDIVGPIRYETVGNMEGLDWTTGPLDVPRRQRLVHRRHHRDLDPLGVRPLGRRSGRREQRRRQRSGHRRRGLACRATRSSSSVTTPRPPTSPRRLRRRWSARRVRVCSALLAVMILMVRSCRMRGTSVMALMCSSPRSLTAEHTYLVDGQYDVTLTVTDDDGATGTAGDRLLTW